MKAVLILVVVLMVFGSVAAQEDTHVAFTLNPRGELQAYAMVGNPAGGDLEIWVDGQWFTQVSLPDMNYGETTVLAVVPNPMQVVVWEIRGAYAYTWSNGGIYQPELELPDLPPPDASLLLPASAPAHDRAIEFSSVNPQPYIVQFVARAGQKHRER